MSDFMYGDYGVYPQAIVFSQGEYQCFVCFEGKIGLYLAQSNDLLSFRNTTLVSEERIYGQPSAYEKNEKIYFFYSTKKGEIKQISIDRKGLIFENPIPIVKHKGLFDPKVSFMDGQFVLLVVNNKKEVLMFLSDNMLDFSFSSYISLPKDKKVRCPSLHMTNERYILFYNDEKGLFYYNITFSDGYKIKGEPIFLEKMDHCRITLLKEGRTILSGCTAGRLVFREVWVKEDQVHLYPLSEIRNRRQHLDMINKQDVLYEKIQSALSRNFSVSLFYKDLNNFAQKVKVCFGDINVNQTYLLMNRERDYIVLGSFFRPKVTKILRVTRNITEVEVYFYDLMMEIAFIEEGFMLSADNPFVGMSESKISISFSEKVNCSIQSFSLDSTSLQFEDGACDL